MTQVEPDFREACWSCLRTSTRSVQLRRPAHPRDQLQGYIGHKNLKQVVRSPSEFQSEADLPLSICREITRGSLRGDLAKGTVVGIGVWAVELRAVEGVEVIHRQNARDVLSDEELLSDIQTFVIER